MMMLCPNCGGDLSISNTIPILDPIGLGPLQYRYEYGCHECGDVYTEEYLEHLSKINGGNLCWICGKEINVAAFAPEDALVCGECAHESGHRMTNAATNESLFVPNNEESS